MQLTIAAVHPEADAAFLSCTNLRTFGVLAEIQQNLGMLVRKAPPGRVSPAPIQARYAVPHPTRLGVFAAFHPLHLICDRTVYKIRPTGRFVNLAGRTPYGVGQAGGSRER